MSAVFVLRSPEVIHETIDGEAVIIDMANGAYYRLEAASALAWNRLASGTSADALCDELGGRFAAAAGEIEQAVAAFLASLEDFKLIVPANGPSLAASAPAPAPAPTGETRVDFPGLAIHRFTDLQELLFLDPVHEVDDSGWPVQPPKQ